MLIQFFQASEGLERFFVYIKVLLFCFTFTVTFIVK